jgi:hypothetical protein
MLILSATANSLASTTPATAELGASPLLSRTGSTFSDEELEVDELPDDDVPILVSPTILG